MKNEKNFSNELAKNLKKKAARKYALIFLVAIIIISVVLGINIEDKDSKLPDGQGNLVASEVVVEDGGDSDVDEGNNISSPEDIENTDISTKEESVTEEEEVKSDKPVDNSTLNNNTITSNPSANESTTTNKPSTDKGTATSKPSVDNDVTTTDKPPTDKNTTTDKPSTDKNTTTDKPSGENNTVTNSPSTDKETTSDNVTDNNTPSAEDLAVDNSNDPTASNGGNSAYKPEEAENVTVTIRISCSTLSNDISQLTNESILEYIPENGVILETVTYRGTTENTVFDVLNTVCRNNGIQLESSYTPLYESYYVEGINYLYEFDVGAGSGWMYKVNGWFPNYGCSSYYLSDGDVIEWVYTCNYGNDVGGKLY